MSVPRPIVYPRDQHPISRSLIDSDALKIMYRLLNNGYKAFLVGGGVRDLLLGKRPKDFDISTDAHPHEIRELFRNSRIIGKRFRLVHVYFRGGKNIEVSTFRDKEEEVDSTASIDPSPLRRDNTYGDEISDALRRDLTINGLFYDLGSYSIIDYVGGVRDLGDGVIRIIGDPLKRFQEDPVRMLRAIRHAARNSFVLEKQCAKIISEHAGLLAGASAVRIYDEFKKDLLFGDIQPTMRLFAKTGLLKVLLPAFSATHFEEKSLLDTTLERMGNMQKNGVDVPTNVAFAVFLIGKIAMDTNLSPEQALENYEDLDELRKNSFSPLSISRRDSEDVSSILRAWKRAFKDSKLPALKSELGQHLLLLSDIFASSLPIGKSAGKMPSKKSAHSGHDHRKTHKVKSPQGSNELVKTGSKKPRSKNHQPRHRLISEQNSLELNTEPASKKLEKTHEDSINE